MCRVSISVESYDYFTGPDNYSCSGIQGQGGGGGETHRDEFIVSWFICMMKISVYRSVCSLDMGVHI